MTLLETINVYDVFLRAKSKSLYLNKRIDGPRESTGDKQHTIYTAVCNTMMYPGSGANALDMFRWDVRMDIF